MSSLTGSGPRVHPTRRPLRDAARSFLADCSARALSPRTLEQYEWSLRSFLIFLPVPAAVLTDLDPENVRAWVESLKPSRRPTSLRTALRPLKVFARWALREGYLRSDSLAVVTLPKAVRPLIVPLEDHEVARLMAAGPPVLRAAVALLVDTGVRASELCGLVIDDIRMEHLFVRGKGGYDRLAPFGESCADELQRYLTRTRPAPRHGDEPLLLLPSGGALSAHRLGELMRKAGSAAGIRGVRVSPHTLRHTFAIEFLRNGGGELALQKTLGHRSLDMVKVYAELTEGDVAAAHRSASPLDQWSGRLTTRAGADRRAARAYRGARAGFGVR
jgi:site-specific recombinase XerD